MYRVALLMLLVFLVAGVPAQETPEVEAPPAAAEAADDTAEATDEATDEAPTIGATADEASTDDAVTAVDEDPDDADLDEQTYEEDDDDFIPTEEIPADEPIAFPSNI
jgi:hypothetical protein